jgi:hypothetical protein
VVNKVSFGMAAKSRILSEGFGVAAVVKWPQFIDHSRAAQQARRAGRDAPSKVSYKAGPTSLPFSWVWPTTVAFLPGTVGG